ncbi:MAG: efflux RND transporter periplasmic adaptor subunit [Planctomycetota bacterium]|jgi:RND family efflux transporter MFP subunit
MSFDSKKSKLLGAFVGAILIIGSIYAVFFVDWGKDKALEPQLVRPLKMVRVGETSLPAVREYPGKVTAKDTVVLAFQVEGQVVELPVLKGEEVKQGDLLAKLDERDYKNRHNAAKAEYEQANAQLDRIKQAVDSGAVSKTDLTNAEAAFERAKANLEIAQKALDDTILRAPYDAIISDTFVENFQNVQAKQNVVGVQNIQSIEVEVSVPQERVLKAKEQTGKFRFTAIFDSLPEIEFDVEVKEYTTQADPLTQTYAVTFTMPFQDEYNIFPGMTASVREYPIESAFPESDRFFVPIDAVPVDGDEQYYVWKAKKTDSDEYTVHRQNVQVGTMEGDSIRITSGLSRGDKIAASGVHQLQEGQIVREFIPKSEVPGK